MIEEEGLLDDERLKSILIRKVGLFKLNSNYSIATLAMSQESWLERLLVGFQLYGRKDATDHQVTLALRKLRQVY